MKWRLVGRAEAGMGRGVKRGGGKAVIMIREPPREAAFD